MEKGNFVYSADCVAGGWGKKNHRKGLYDWIAQTHQGCVPQTDGETTMRTNDMQPRGQLWFALEDICKDFRSFSGLSDKESLEVLVVVLTNMLDIQKHELETLTEATESL